MFRHSIPLVATGWLLLAVSAAPAQLQFAQTTLDAGTVYSGKPLALKFDCVNAGRQTVEIVEAHPSCGCAKPTVSQTSFPPGARGWVEIAVHTLGQPSGPSAWAVRLKVKSGDQVTEIPLQINGQLVAEVSAEPATLQMFTNQGIAAEMKVFDTRANPFQVKTVQTTSPQLTAEVVRSEVRTSAKGTPFRESVVRLQVADDFPDGRHEEIVSIYTTDPSYAELTMPVTIVKTPRQRITATPGSLVLTAAPGQPVPSRVFLLRDRDNQEVTVERAAADHPAISCSWATGPGAMATLKVRVDHQQLPPQGLHGSVQVTVSRPVPLTLTIPVDVRTANVPR